MYTVFVRGLELYAYHGVPAEERVIGHRYRLDLQMQVKGKATSTDSIDDTVNYASAADLLAQLVQGNQFLTVERLAYFAAEALLDEYPQVKSVELSVAKRLPPAPFIVEEVGVTIKRDRS